MSETKLQVTPTDIPEVLVLEPKVFGDNRGWFTESFNANDFATATGLDVEFVQDNHSFSRQWTLRGMHFQKGSAAEAKLVRASGRRISNRNRIGPAPSMRAASYKSLGMLCIAATYKITLNPR